MQNAWRFVEDRPLRERLREAKGIGTPATRGGDHRGAEGAGIPRRAGKEHRVDTAGPCLFEVLRRAAAALVAPGVTAQFECLLDDV